MSRVLLHDDNQLQVETYEFEPIKGYQKATPGSTGKASAHFVQHIIILPN